MFRSLSLFGLLIGLFATYYVVHVYFATLNELDDLKAIADQQEEQLIDLRNENLVMKASLESHTGMISALKYSEKTLNLTFQECSYHLQTMNKERGENSAKLYLAITEQMICSNNLTTMEGLLVNLRNELAILTIQLSQCENQPVDVKATVEGDESEKVDNPVNNYGNLSAVSDMVQNGSDLDAASAKLSSEDAIKPLVDAEEQSSVIQPSEKHVDLIENPGVYGGYPEMPKGPGDRVKMEMDEGVAENDKSNLIIGSAENGFQNLRDNLMEMPEKV